MKINAKELFKKQEVQDSLLSKEGRRAFVNLTGFRGYLICYKGHKYTLDFALFHSELINSLENDKDFIGVLGFRGCGKSTILEDYAEYCLLNGISKYTLYIGSTDEKSKTAIRNIKNEVESNTLLLSDYDIDIKVSKYNMNEKWAESQISLIGNTIQAKSRGAKVRGVKYQDSRITLVICDDLEDSENTKNSDIRKKTREWFFTELVPAMASDEVSKGTKIVMLGNLVHKDCLLAHLENKQNDNTSLIKVLRFPLEDENGEVTWKAMYPTKESVEKAKAKVMLAGEGMGAVIWAREFLLKMIDEQDQVIKDNEIQYYTQDWLQRPFIKGGVGIDLAISLKQTADYTSMVKGVIVNNDYGEKRLIILPNPVKERLGFENTISKAKVIKAEMPENTTFYVEDVAYQKASIEIMQKNGINAKGVIPRGDKRSRLINISMYIKSGMVLFPKQGAEQLLEEILGFGIEPHDDLLDAFVHLVGNILNQQEVICV